MNNLIYEVLFKKFYLLIYNNNFANENISKI